jgi:hypothetical protein
MAKFRLQRLKGGRKHIIQTDSAADYLRCLVDEMAGDFRVVEVESAPEAPLLDRASEFRFGEFADELHHVFSTFYECTPGPAATLSRSWSVRHRRGCPWI